MTEAGRQMSLLMESKDSDYGDEKSEVSLLIRKVLIRSYLLFLSENTISKIKKQFVRFIKDKKYNERNPHHEIGKNAVIDCFDDSYDDKILLSASSILKDKKRFS